MVGATELEMETSLSAHEELRVEGRRVSFSDPAAKVLTINLRVKEPHQLVHLARLLVSIGREESHFATAYLWITAWGVWNPWEEAVAFKTLEQFRRSLGENRSVQSAPGHFFRHDELVESVCCLLPAMTVGWDAYYVPTWAAGGLDHFLFVSHDGFVDLHVRTKEMHDRVSKVLADRGWIADLARF